MDLDTPRNEPLKNEGMWQDSDAWVPGDVIIALNLGASATLYLSPRDVEGEHQEVELEHGHCYCLSGDARWHWVHGLSVNEGQKARRAVV